MVDWPSSLEIPTARLSGIGDQRQGAKIRSQTDSGIALQRRRFTTAIRNVDIPVSFTSTERAIFETFYHTTLQEGTLAFNWRDPLTDATTTFRFREDTGPAWSGSGGGENQKWNATLALELLP